MGEGGDITFIRFAPGGGGSPLQKETEMLLFSKDGFCDNTMKNNVQEDVLIMSNNEYVRFRTMIFTILYTIIIRSFDFLGDSMLP